MVVFVDRWSLYRGALVSLKWPMKQPTNVTIARWPFNTSGFKTGFTVHTYIALRHTVSNGMHVLLAVCIFLLGVQCSLFLE